MLTKLNRHNLEIKAVFGFIKDSLCKSNMLSGGLLKRVNFQTDGSFYTLLSDEANLEALNDFNSPILVQNPVIQIASGKRQIIPNLREEIADILFNKIKADPSLYCVIDDVIRKPTDKDVSGLFNVCGSSYNNEMYYLINRSNNSRDLILRCLKNSNAFWHSLCLLTKISVSRSEENKLTFEKIKSICQSSVMIIMGAYDGEGYILWERNP
jgi:hypothetical protein